MHICSRSSSLGTHGSRILKRMTLSKPARPRCDSADFEVAQSIAARLATPTGFVYRELVTAPRGQPKPKTVVATTLRHADLFRALRQHATSLSFTKHQMRRVLRLVGKRPRPPFGGTVQVY